MRAHDWDIENTRFGPVSERYRQPSLINNMAEHSRVLREAKDICAAADAFNNGERVRNTLPLGRLTSTCFDHEHCNGDSCH